MFKYIVLTLLLCNVLLYPSESYIDQIKVWDECTYSMETIRIDLMQLKNNPFEDIKPQKAIKLCKKSLENYPDDPHVKFLLSRAYTKNKQYEKGFSLASQACKNGDIGGCTLLGGYYSMGLIPQKYSNKKSFLLWLWSCSKRDSQACVNFYNMASMHAPFFPKEMEDYDLRLLYLCSRGDFPPSCYEYAKNCSKDQLYSQECKYASARSCIAGNSIGCLLYSEQLDKESNKKAKAEEKHHVYTKSCNNGNKESCRYIANLYASKKHTKLNNIMALAIYENTCIKGKDAVSCHYAGNYYLSSLDGITPNISLGITYLEESCKPKTIYKEAPGYSSTTIDYDIKGCLDLSKYYLNAPQKKYRDKEKARKTLKQACTLSEYYHTSKLGCSLNIQKCCNNLKH